MKRLIPFLAVLISALLMVVGCSSSNPSGATDENEESGNQSENSVLKVALPTQPPTLDQPTSTATVTRDAARLMYETLVTTDSEYKAVPMLAESVDVSDDNKIYTFKLREGVKFHNGDEMLAEDVIASMERWVEKSSVTGSMFEGATWEADGDYTVVLQLESPSVFVLDTMASQKMAAAIMPKEIVDEADADGVKEYIGTGPYKFVDWKQDQYIHFTKNEDYQPVDEPADGLAGEKIANIDDIYLYIVTDSSTRYTGLQTGEYDLIYTVPFDSYDQLKNETNVYPVFDTYGETLIVYNENEGISSNLKFRQALNAAYDVEQMMFAAFVDEDLYWLHPSYMTKTVTNWATDAGKEFYNQHDLDKAKQLLEESDYNNEELRVLTTRDYPQFYNIAVVMEEQLKAIGVNVKLEIYDWPTLLEKQEQPTEWDASVIGSSIVTTPSQLLYISPSFAGGKRNETILGLKDQIEDASTLEEAQVLWEELQQYAWEEHLPITMLGGYNNLYGANNKVQGIETLTGPIFWNATIEN
ncbi:ABC transporter substrate-binding protein [Ornithinibacillus sp. 4-3]|uniref:ABC transporter substrate-binding protein n=1 Tax=Ornithinibacillus sp. 4-3 TaxID=3231488 RepID=A0AB39HJL0_9BACI